jgi:hypothetical protein
MKRLAQLAVLLVVPGIVLSGVALGQAVRGSTEHAFVPGGRVKLNLSAGDYTVRAGRDDRILVTWDTGDPDEKGRASITADTTARTATVVTSGPRGTFHVVIELPAHADLNVDLSAGNLRVDGISGNKKVGSWAGNVDIKVGRPEEYARVDAAVKAGDLIASAFQTTKSGLFRSFSWNGPGQYTLDVRLTAGNLRLYAAGGK